ncbi:MAG: hypothetical protein BGO49_10770 [Planctomycetales bacterium 71-10]|nr:MAG: hypothetical protein BGO49_10770 [Planctomycetales bacterium 71-10]
MHNSDRRMEDCIKQCQECSDVCQDTLYNHCLEMGGEHAEAQHVKLMTDCIQACVTAAEFMSRNSPHHGALCAACAEICEACAESCDRIGGKEMDRCAEVCRSCAESCREMSKMKKAA